MKCARYKLIVHFKEGKQSNVSNVRGPDRQRIIDLRGGKINHHLLGKHFCFPHLQQLPNLGLGPLMNFLS